MEPKFQSTPPEIGYIPAGDIQEAAKIEQIMKHGTEQQARYRDWVFDKLYPVHTSIHKNFKRYRASVPSLVIFQERPRFSAGTSRVPC